MYFEQDSSEQWALSNREECLVCHKHRLTVVVYQNEKLFPISPDAKGYDPNALYNEELIEIKNSDVVKQIKQSLNLMAKETNDLNPIICGTVVNGGFNRKLRMMRADLFSGLAISHSYQYVSNRKQTNAIKKGIQAVLSNCNFANLAYNLSN